MEDYAGARDYDRAEYNRALRDLDQAQRAVAPARTFRQVVKDEWITVLVVLVIVVIPMGLALKGAIL